MSTATSAVTRWPAASGPGRWRRRQTCLPAAAGLWCRTPLSAPEAVAVVEEIARRCGAVVVRMSAEQHDLAVARVSHLPHVVAAVTAGLLLGRPPNILR